MNRKYSTIITVVISVAITISIICGIGYYVYNKYIVNELAQKMIIKNIIDSIKDKGINDIISGPLKKLVNTGELKGTIVQKLEELTKSKVTIDEIDYYDDKGLVFNNVKLVKDKDTVFIESVTIDSANGIMLNRITRTGAKDGDTISAGSARVGLNSITLLDFGINPTAEITVENPRFVAEKVVIGFDLTDILDQKSLILSGLKINNFNLFLINRPNGVWLFMDSLKELADKLNLPEYSEMLRDGAIARNGEVSLIDTVSPDETIHSSGVDISFKPHAGNLRDVKIEGAAHDEFLGNLSLTGNLDLYAPKLDIKVTMDNVKVTEDFLKKLPTIGEKLWASYMPVGDLSIDGSMKFYTIGTERIFEPAININLNDMEITYDDWPFTTTRVTGQLKFLKNKLNIVNLNGYVFEDGQHGANIKFNAMMEIGKPELKLIVTAMDVNLTDELVAKLPEICSTLQDTFKPEGTADLKVTYQVEDTGEIKSDYIIELDCKNWNLTYPEIPVPLKNINGRVVISENIEDGLFGKNKGRVQLLGMAGYFNADSKKVPFDFSGDIDIDSDKKILNIKIPDLNVTDEVLQYLPEEYKTALKDFTPSGKTDMSIVYDNRDSDKPNLAIALDCEDCEFVDTRFPASFHSVSGTINITDNHISANHIEGKCYDGQVNGSVLIDTEKSDYQYNGDFAFSEMNMHQLMNNFFKTEQDWPGLLSGKVKFNHGKDNQEGFDASGTIILKEGSISNVPVALSIINLFNLGLPGKVIFESGYANFIIKDNIVKIDEAKVYSDSIELTARGEVGFDGSLDITVIVGFSNNILLDIPVVGKFVEFVVGTVRKRLTKVHVGGTIKDPKSTLSMLHPRKSPIKSTVDLIPADSNGTGTTTIKTKQFKAKN